MRSMISCTLAAMELRCPGLRYQSACEFPVKFGRSFPAGKRPGEGDGVEVAS